MRLNLTVTIYAPEELFSVSDSMKRSTEEFLDEHDWFIRKSELFGLRTPDSNSSTFRIYYITKPHFKLRWYYKIS